MICSLKGLSSSEKASLISAPLLRSVYASEETSTKPLFSHTGHFGVRIKTVVLLIIITPYLKSENLLEQDTAFQDFCQAYL
jgi:hypothetical protein